MFTLLISLLLSLVVLVQIKLDYNKKESPVVKHTEQPVQSVGVAYIMPRTPLKLIEHVQNSTLKEVIPDKRKQYREWKENLQTYEQLRLKLYTN